MFLQNLGQRDAKFLHFHPTFLRRRRRDAIGAETVAVSNFAAASSVDRKIGVAQNREQPGAQVGAGLEMVGVGPGLEQRLPHEIVGPVHIS